jgi:glycosyltransferase involved in cell wall biosynthesis
LSQTLDSFICQNYRNWEIILIDDDSTDYTTELSLLYEESENRITCFKRPSEMPKGANSCRNFGYSKSSGEIIIWFDSDDCLLPGSLDLIQENIKNKDFLIYGAVRTNENLEPIGEMNLWETQDVFSDYLMWKFKIVTNSLAFSKKFLLEKKLFDEDLPFGHETTFFARLFANVKKENYKIINDSLFYYRTHERGISQINVQGYNRNLVLSHIYTYCRNLELCIEKQNKILINFQYGKVINYIFRASKFSDFYIITLGISELSKRTRQINNKSILLNIGFRAYLCCALGAEGYNFKKKLISRGIV